jgi:hypothetical protein
LLSTAAALSTAHQVFTTGFNYRNYRNYREKGNFLWKLYFEGFLQNDYA